MGKGWTTILDHVVSFERSGKFLYASVLTDPNNIVSISDMRLVVRNPNLWNVSNKDTAQPVHPHSLISAFVISSLEIENLHECSYRAT